jgi:hypothetical protein
MPIEMPTTPGFTTCRFGLQTNTQTFSSPLTKSSQRMLLGGAQWSASYSLPAMKRDQAAPWKAFFLSLEGSVNTFNGFDPDCKTPRGTATGTPLVNGANQNGSTLIIDGCTHSILGWLLPGDYFACNGELKMITARVDTDGSGNATLNFKPSLRNSPADNAAITLNRASCSMTLTDDMQAIWECDSNGIYQAKTFTAIEAFT